MRSSRTVTAFALSATLSAIVLLGACSSSGSSDTTVADAAASLTANTAADTAAAVTEAVAAPTTAGAAVTGSASAAELVKSFTDISGTVLTDTQTGCATEGIVSAFPEDELIALGKNTGGFDALSDANRAKAVGALQKCPGVLEEVLFSVFQQSAPGLDETQGRCGVTAIGKAFTPDELAQLSTSATAAQDPKIITRVFMAFETCDGLLRSLLAGGLQQSAGLTEKQATCAAEAMIKEIGPETSVKILTDPTGIDPAVQAKLVSALGACTK